MHDRFKTATACIKPYSIPMAKEVLAGSGVLICPVIAFPHGNSSTNVKVYEATEAVKAVGVWVTHRLETDGENRGAMRLTWLLT